MSEKLSLALMIMAVGMSTVFFTFFRGGLQNVCWHAQSLSLIFIEPPSPPQPVPGHRNAARRLKPDHA